MENAEPKTAKILKRVITLLALVTVLFFIFTPANNASAEVSSINSSTDTEVNTPTVSPEDSACASCHEQIAQGFVKTVHGKAKKHAALVKTGNASSEAAVSCQSCHGDGTEHIANGGDATKIKNPAKLNAAEASKNCSQCHSQNNEHAVWRGSKHEAAGLSCLSCHSAHHSPVAKFSESKLFASAEAETKLLKKNSQAETCFQCHTELRKAQFQRSTHLFRNENLEHKITCSTCHEPHGSIGEKMMRTATANETCYQCHTEKRGPFLFEHSPVRENCGSCHKAHGSNNAALLAAKTPMLCQQCHIQGRHQTVAGVSNSVFTSGRGCVQCHPQVHGSNHPSGINLQR
ncbi:MAG: DmsE family decaheme c-type cytochrome [Acidobacteriota bacterium]